MAAAASFQGRVGYDLTFIVAESEEGILKAASPAAKQMNPHRSLIFHQKPGSQFHLQKTQKRSGYPLHFGNAVYMAVISLLE